ncbi:MAG: tetratricopeptide repeat protein, partial [Spirochaetaceae bacterium]|nr:tetratricopeptide repeat protein [Spirochaetaceae bacterium]
MAGTHQDTTHRNLSILPVLSIILFGLLSSCSSPPKEPEQVFTRRNQAESMMAQGHTMTDSLQLAGARASYEGALDIYASLDDRYGTVSALLALGRNSRAAGDPESARDLYTHAEALAVQSGDARLIRDAKNHLADIALRSGDPVTAWEYLDDTTPAVTEGGIHAAQLRLMGSVKYELGSPDEANDYLSQAVNTALVADDMNEAAQA